MAPFTRGPTEGEPAHDRGRGVEGDRSWESEGRRRALSGPLEACGLVTPLRAAGSMHRYDEPFPGSVALTGQTPTRRRAMTTERAVRLLAGTLIGISLILGYTMSPAWFLLGAFVSLNLIQSAFTGSARRKRSSVLSARPPEEAAPRRREPRERCTWQTLSSSPAPACWFWAAAPRRLDAAGGRRDARDRSRRARGRHRPRRRMTPALSAAVRIGPSRSRTPSPSHCSAIPISSRRPNASALRRRSSVRRPQRSSRRSPRASATRARTIRRRRLR